MAMFENAYDSVLPHRAAMVYLYLRDRAGRKGICWPGINTIAEDLKLSRSTVKRALADLQAAGRISKEARFRDNGSQSSWLYKILL